MDSRVFLEPTISVQWCFDSWKVTRLLDWGTEAADFHAEIRYQLRAAGTPIGDMDTLIAAHALAANAVLVTSNMRHFEPIKLPLILENRMQ